MGGRVGSDIDVQSVIVGQRINRLELPPGGAALVAVAVFTACLFSMKRNATGRRSTELASFDILGSQHVVLKRLNRSSQFVCGLRHAAVRITSHRNTMCY